MEIILVLSLLIWGWMIAVPLFVAIASLVALPVFWIAELLNPQGGEIVVEKAAEKAAEKARLKADAKKEKEKEWARKNKTIQANNIREVREFIANCDDFVTIRMM